MILTIITITITKEHFLVDKMVMRNCKRRKTNLAMAWIDYKKAYDIVPHPWIFRGPKTHRSSSEQPAAFGGSHEELAYDSDVKWAEPR